MFLHYAPSQAVLQNMVKPRMRATAAFVFFFIVSMLGYGVGPTLLGLISDALARHAFTLGGYAALCPGGAPMDPARLDLAAACHAASAYGIRGAMLVMSCLFFWAGPAFFGSPPAPCARICAWRRHDERTFTRSPGATHRG